MRPRTVNPQHDAKLDRATTLTVDALEDAATSTADQSAALQTTVRQRLRALRTERGLTLQQVAERASLDVSTLSRLESGKRRLALDHLPPLAAALGTTTDELLGPQPRRDPRVRSLPRTADGLTMWPLTHRESASPLRAYKVLVHPDRNAPPEPPLPVHEGQDWVYVLSGRLRLLLDDREFIVEPGEAAEFTTWTPHWFGAIDGPVEMLLIVGAHGERIHLHE
ncbi:MAG: cupin domain-containing protein [Solirubrobacteraceae bacterium]|nr:cupin domain-containing protein [Solirubrobacteraceae bacterium]